MPAQDSVPPFFFVLELPALHRPQYRKISFGHLPISWTITQFCLLEGHLTLEVSEGMPLRLSRFNGGPPCANRSAPTSGIDLTEPRRRYRDGHLTQYISVM